jgi:hypothetical protein
MVKLNFITGLTNRKLRLVTAAGSLGALGAVLAGAAAVACKLFFWSSFNLGAAPMVIGLCFLGAVQLASLGIIGDYIGAAFAQPRGYATGKPRTGF